MLNYLDFKNYSENIFHIMSVSTMSVPYNVSSILNLIGTILVLYQLFRVISILNSISFIPYQFLTSFLQGQLPTMQGFSGLQCRFHFRLPFFYQQLSRPPKPCHNVFHLKFFLRMKFSYSNKKFTYNCEKSLAVVMI